MSASKPATRTFDDRPAVREKTPLLVGLVGPSGTGKTFSALRLAAGMQRSTPGETFLIDTEARRSLHYAEKFKFRHVAFGAPFSPLDYLDAINHCIKQGAGRIIVDSMSHEHEGPGGVLETHEAELDRIAGSDWDKRERCNMLAWGKPKRERRRLINTLLQLPCDFIFCFRAKQKMKLEPGKKPEALGYMPIAGEEFMFELTLKCLLLPGANGFPTWQSTQVGEKAMIKLPEQFRETFAKAPQLTEDIGEQLARWAAGGSASSSSAPATPAPTPVPAAELVKRYEACSDPATFRSLGELARASWSRLSTKDQARVQHAVDAAKERIAAAIAAKEQEAKMFAGDPQPPADEAPSGGISDEDKRAIELAEAAGQ